VIGDPCEVVDLTTRLIRGLRITGSIVGEKSNSAIRDGCPDPAVPAAHPDLMGDSPDQANNFDQINFRDCE
jgi:hypothetical protein